jgi:uncharacterized protein (TIGR00661 family)
MKDLPGDLKKKFKVDVQCGQGSETHIIISDFEFYSNLLSKIMRLPLISLDNMHVPHQAELNVPRNYRTERLAAESVVRSFIQLPTRCLITSYFYPPLKIRKSANTSPSLRMRS